MARPMEMIESSTRQCAEKMRDRLRALWLMMEQPCGKRMKDMLSLRIGHGDEKPAMRKRL